MAEDAFAKIKQGSVEVCQLHRESYVSYFVTARAKFSGEFTTEGGLPLHAEDRLKMTESLLVMGHKPTEGEWHVITIGAVDSGFVVKDTNHNKVDHFESLEHILPFYGSDYKFSSDSVFYEAVS